MKTTQVIEILIALGTLKRFNTLQEAIEWINSNYETPSGRELNRNQAIEKYNVEGKKIYLYIFGDVAKKKIGLSQSYTYCSNIDEFAQFMYGHNIVNDLAKLLK